jgi:hypothetical protein
MPAAPTAAPVAPSRPTLIDYLLLLTGCGLSLYLIQLATLPVTITGDVGPRARMFVQHLGAPLRLSEGIILLWPLLFFLQRLLGRSQGLTGGEWLWVLSWLGVAVLVGLDVWRNIPDLPELPDFIQSQPARPRALWYMTFVPAMVVVALVLALVGLVGRGPTPWTQPLSLALMIWPALPLAIIVSLGKLG